MKILHQNRERIAADDGFNLTNYVQRCDDLTDLEVETKPLFSIGQFNYFATERILNYDDDGFKIWICIATI